MAHPDEYEREEFTLDVECAEMNKVFRQIDRHRSPSTAELVAWLTWATRCINSLSEDMIRDNT